MFARYLLGRRHDECNGESRVYSVRIRGTTTQITCGPVAPLIQKC
jgi:hypothetical protein